MDENTFTAIVDITVSCGCCTFPHSFTGSREKCDKFVEDKQAQFGDSIRWITIWDNSNDEVVFEV